MVMGSPLTVNGSPGLNEDWKVPSSVVLGFGTCAYMTPPQMRVSLFPPPPIPPTT